MALQGTRRYPLSYLFTLEFVLYTDGRNRRYADISARPRYRRTANAPNACATTERLLRPPAWPYSRHTKPSYSRALPRPLLSIDARRRSRSGLKPAFCQQQQQLIHGSHHASGDSSLYPWGSRTCAAGIWMHVGYRANSASVGQHPLDVGFVWFGRLGRSEFYFSWSRRHIKNTTIVPQLRMDLFSFSFIHSV